MTVDPVNILLVEDSLTQALTLCHLLEKNGYGVVQAENGRQALACLEESPDPLPDMVVSDIVMPEMDGYELCRKIRGSRRLKHVPVLLLTSLSEPEDIIRGLECGADNFVTKPCKDGELLSRIQYMLVNRDLRRDRQADSGMEIYFSGKKYWINSDRIQIVDHLFAAYESVLRQKKEMEKVNRDLKEALQTIRTLRGILPICAGCKKIRDTEGQWQFMESYISRHTDAQLSHGLCPECAGRLYPEFAGKRGK